MSSYPSHPTGLATGLASGLALTAGLLITTVGLPSTASAQTSLTWVKDINTTPVILSTSSTPYPARASLNLNSQKWLRMGSYFYFVANNGTAGSELYRSNGVTENLVKDINPGSSSSSPAQLTLVGNKIFFSAWTSATGREIWVSDGTAAGTKMLKDIRRGSLSGLSSFQSNFARVGNKVVFGANDGSAGTELWISDGTAAGTTLLKNIRGGASSSSPDQLTSNQAGTKVFFRANDGTAGAELWVTDGTTAGTRLVKDIRGGALSSYPQAFLHLGTQKVVFSASDGTTGYELWVSDGTAAGTVLVKDVYAGLTSGTSTYYGVSMGNKVLFRGYTAAAGYEPWITDGTAAGTMILKDIRIGRPSSDLRYADSDGGKVYWGCSTATGRYEIWMTDGTPAGTKRFSKASMSRGVPYNLAATGGKVFFAGFDVTPSTGYELCMTDGTTTTTVKDIRTGRNSGLSTYSNYIAEIGPGKVAFRANDGSGDELWISQGTSATTKMIDINKPTLPAPTASDRVSNIEPFFGKVIFAATDGSVASKGQHGLELWISDGTSANTKLLKDINTSTSTSGTAWGSTPHSLCRLGNYIYFSATDGKAGYELWRTDGTTAGTMLFKDIRLGLSSSFPRDLTRVGDRIFFQANEGSNGAELWVTDGTVAGTKMVKNIRSGSYGSSPYSFARLGRTNKVLFRANDGLVGTELWISDGTTAGTRLVKDINSGSRFRSSNPIYLTSYKGKVYFQAYTLTTGFELWVSDGTSAGTKMVKDAVGGRFSGYAHHLTVQNGKLYFRAYTAAAGYEIHSSDGTAANTGLYWDFSAGASHTYPQYLTAVGSRRVYFSGLEATSYSSGEPHFFDVTNKTSMTWNANAKSGSKPSNFAHGRYSLAVDNGNVYASASRSTISDYQLLKISNGATAQRIGRAQDSTVFAATDPLIGRNMRVSGATAVTNPLSVVCLGVPVGTPFGLSWFAPKSYAYFNLTSYFFVLGNYTGTSYNVPVPVPNDPGFVGRTAVMQSFALDMVAFPAKTQASNGVHITFGR